MRIFYAKKEFTPAYKAVRNRYWEIVERVLKYGSDEINVEMEPGGEYIFAEIVVS
jgi:hypothetical protein